MVHFTLCRLRALFYSGAGCTDRSVRVTPFGCPGFMRICAPRPGFSQLIASFFASQLHGIRHKPTFA